MVYFQENYDEFTKNYYINKLAKDKSKLEVELNDINKKILHQKMKKFNEEHPEYAMGRCLKNIDRDDYLKILIPSM